ALVGLSSSITRKAYVGLIPMRGYPAARHAARDHHDAPSRDGPGIPPSQESRAAAVFQPAFGNAHVFFPEASVDRCTAALLLEVDPVGLVRGRRGPAGEAFALQQYVNDRPYVASSLMSVAIAQVFGSALAGTSRERP